MVVIKKYHKVDLSNERDISLRILINAIDNDYSLEAELDFFEKNFKADYQKISFSHELTQGVFRYLLLLDEYIKLLTQPKFNKIDKIILNILRLAIYQLVFMDSPDFAIVNESVSLARKYSNEGSVKFVNGVLRNFLRKKDELSKNIDKYDFYQKIIIKNSIPYWIVNYWGSFLAKNELEELCFSMNQKPLIYLRINTLRTSIIQFKELLKEKEIIFYDTHIENIIRLENKTNLKNIPNYNEGFWYIQDIASSSVSYYLNPQKNQNIIDFCSFPGGKTSYTSELMANTGIIYAIDSNKKREKTFLENINRLGCKNIKTIITSAESELPLEKEFADKILVDPPCSGLGVMRKKLEVRYKRKKEDIIRLSELQLSILDNASKYLKNNGELFYSTCTISNLENELVIKTFLENNKNFVLAPINEKTTYKNFYPYKDNSDGFFIAKIIKKN